jgi:hypothetical protein
VCPFPSTIMLLLSTTIESLMLAVKTYVMLSPLAMYVVPSTLPSALR